VPVSSWLEWVWVPLAVAVAGGVLVGVVLLVLEYRSGWFARRGSSSGEATGEGQAAVEGEAGEVGSTMVRRKRIPEERVAGLLARSRRRCCLCYGLDGDLSEKQGQIAHLDGDRSNNDPDNLAFLCLNHHDRYDSRTSQSKGLTMEEVKRYRGELYEVVKERGVGQSKAERPRPADVREVVQVGNSLIRLLRGVRLSRVVQVGKSRIEVTEGEHLDEEDTDT
jgi:hypothetical protein